MRTFIFNSVLFLVAMISLIAALRPLVAAYKVATTPVPNEPTQNLTPAQPVIEYEPEYVSRAWPMPQTNLPQLPTIDIR